MWFDRLTMSGEELPPLVLSLSKDTGGGRAPTSVDMVTSREP